jgi:hypothetical protein
MLHNRFFLILRLEVKIFRKKAVNESKNVCLSEVISWKFPLCSDEFQHDESFAIHSTWIWLTDKLRMGVKIWWIQETFLKLFSNFLKKIVSLFTFHAIFFIKKFLTLSNFHSEPPKNFFIAFCLAKSDE